MDDIRSGKCATGDLAERPESGAGGVSGGVSALRKCWHCARPGWERSATPGTPAAVVEAVRLLCGEAPEYLDDSDQWTLPATTEELHVAVLDLVHWLDRNAAGGKLTPMKRRTQPTAEQLEHIRQAAREARVAAGLPAEPPEDAEYEQLQAERRRRARRKR